MPTTLQELTEFHEFATEQIRNGSSDLSLEQLLDLWRASHPTEEELRESVAAVRQAIRDMEAGDTGLPAEDHIREVNAAIRRGIAEADAGMGRPLDEFMDEFRQRHKTCQNPND